MSFRVKIKHPGLITRIVQDRFGEDAHYTGLPAKNRHTVLRVLKNRGYKNQQIQGSLAAQVAFRKHHDWKNRDKFAADRTWVANKLFPK